MLNTVSASLMPNGLAMESGEKPSSGPGRRYCAKDRALAMSANHTTALQRGDRSRPFGKSKNSRTIRVTIFEPESQPESQAATSPWGSESGRVARAYTAYSPQRIVSVPLRPKTQKIQPIELIGLREAMSAPTVVKDMKRRTKPISIIHGSASSTLNAERFKDWRYKPAIKENSEIAPMPQASQAAVRVLIASIMTQTTRCRSVEGGAGCCAAVVVDMISFLCRQIIDYEVDGSPGTPNPRHPPHSLFTYD